MCEGHCDDCKCCSSSKPQKYSSDYRIWGGTQSAEVDFKAMMEAELNKMSAHIKQESGCVYVGDLVNVFALTMAKIYTEILNPLPAHKQSKMFDGLTDFTGVTITINRTSPVPEPVGYIHIRFPEQEFLKYVFSFQISIRKPSSDLMDVFDEEVLMPADGSSPKGRMNAQFRHVWHLFQPHSVTLWANVCLDVKSAGGLVDELKVERPCSPPSAIKYGLCGVSEEFEKLTEVRNWYITDGEPTGPDGYEEVQYNGVSVMQSAEFDKCGMRFIEPVYEPDNTARHLVMSNLVVEYRP